MLADTWLQSTQELFSFSRIRNTYAQELAPGARIAAYVSSTAPADTDFTEYKNNRVATINEGLARCRASKGDVVLVMPGHTENVATPDAWQSMITGSRIVGAGWGTLRPTITWTTALSTVLFDVANVTLENCILNLEPGAGPIAVAAPITVTGAGCAFVNNTMRFATDVNNYATIGITLNAADLSFVGNTCYGATAGVSTTFMDINAAHRLYMAGNMFSGATSAAGVGIVRFVTAASLHVKLVRNVYINRIALSQCAVTGLANVSGVSYEEHFAYLDTASLTPWLTSTGIMSFHRPTVSNNVGDTGTEVVGTVSA